MEWNTNKLRAVGITLLAAFALMACGGATTSTSAPTAAPAVTSAASASAPTTASSSSTDSASAPTAANAASTEAPAATTPAETAATAPAASTGAATNTKLNLNEVTEDQLMSAIPGFSARMVREFQEYRPYVSIQQFRKEIGKYVSAEQVTAYEQYVYVPIDVDQADAATLQQIPGLDAASADALIAARPYGSNQAFLTKLAQAAPSVDAQLAQAYLAAK